MITGEHNNGAEKSEKDCIYEDHCFEVIFIINMKR